MNSLTRTIVVVVFVFLAGRLPGQEPTRAAIAKQAKAATALVEVTKTRHGSAFCIHETGYFLSNQHVVGLAGEVKLVLRPGQKDMKVVKARVLRADKDLDLALLKVDDRIPLTPLPLGWSDGLAELAEVIAAGFPFGTTLALDDGAYPAVSVNAGRVTALRTKNGALERIQMDAVVNPGNSGGPVLDARGKVVGVVVSGVRGATVNLAIPVSHVRRFVEPPDVKLTYPLVDFANRYRRAEFQVKATSLVPLSESPFQVELRLGNKIEGNRLTIATNCNDERRPAQFTTSLMAGPERAVFVRVYKRKARSEGN